MKLLAINDPHVAATPPEGCRPVYTEDVFTMLEECRDIARQQEVYMTILSGDLFHNKQNVAHWVVRRLITLFKNWPGYVVAIAGNHDLGAGGLASLPNQPLGVLFEAGALHWLEEDELWTDGEIQVQLSPANYTDELDSDPANFGLVRNPLADWAVKISHGSLVPPGKKYPDSFRVITYDQIPVENTDLVINGHIHNDNGVKTVNGCVFAGLGSIGRVARTDYNKRQPRVLLVTLTKDEMTCEKVTLALAVEPELLYYAKSQPDVEIDEPMARFARDMEKSLALEDVSLDDALASVTGKGVDKAVVSVVKDMLERSGY